MPEMINPYIAGAPVVETRMFFGREDVFDWIQNSLTGRYADHTLVIHGQRRVGKTSVLKQLGNRLPKKYIPVFFDLQGRTHTTLDHFLWWLAREIVRVLKQERDITFPVPEKEAFTQDIEYFEHRFLPDLRTVLGGNALLLTFDEFDNLEESEIKEELAIPLIDYLRRLMGQEGLNFIFSIGSSGRKLENMQASYTQFFKTALYKKISFLSRDQSAGLITHPVEGLLTYSPQAVGRIYDITSGHPYFTQLICHELFSACQQTGELSIQEKDVEAVLEDVVERGTVNLKFVWDEASDIEKWGLASLAHLEGKTDTPALANFLRKQRLRFSEPDLTSGLLRLREKDILTKENRFVIYLLKLWLKKNRPIEQVREELTEVNPIANRYIEIGMEFQAGGQFEKAIENFREALAIAPEHVQAQVNIALAYMGQKLYDKAVVEFEKALAMDDEDVSARSGLCEAHLALGDAAMTRGRTKEATLSYQRVLTINAEHLEARQRMAELSRQRAEKALTDGKDEEALSAFAEALKFTPEDGALIARSEKVRAEKNAKVLTGQVARSDKEASAHNWDKAFAALNDALLIAPGDESILKKIKAIQEKQLRGRLDAILAKVEAAEKVNRWDTAIAALNEYLQLKPDDTAIQKRLADMLEAKHASWLTATLARVDQAAAAQNWDEALTTLNEALRLEPDNAEMQAKAVQVHAARRSAELNLMLRRADQAAGAGRWDEAINVLNDGLASDPENETLQTKLAEARKAKREARLQAALRFADSAAQAGKWEAAVASLNEVLANEPDNADFQKKLAEVRLREHASQWDAARLQAEGLRDTGRFEDALQVWRAYLFLHPEDRERVEAEIRQVAQALELLDLYTNAGTAIAARDFDGAIRLLKDIIIRDENYKDASRLLTKAIESRRTAPRQKQDKPRQKPERILKPRSPGEPKTGGRRIWIGGLLGLLILGIGGGLFWLGKNGLFAAPAPTGTATRAAPTLTPTPTLDPELQAALDTIQNEEPLYQTNFDDWDSDDTGRNAAIVNGKLILTSEDENGATLGLNAYSSDSYAVEFELSILGDSSSGSHCVYEAANNAQFGEESWRSFSAEFHLGEDSAALSIFDPQLQEQPRIATAPYDKTKSNVFTLVVLGDRITAFINGQLAYTAQDPAGSAVYFQHSLSAYNQVTCEFEHFKYWDLREMDSAVKIALATIQNEAPFYQYSFDSLAFVGEGGNVREENGKLIVTSENQGFAVAHLRHNSSSLDKFAVEFDLRILESSPEGSCVYATSDLVESGNTDVWANFFSNGQASLNYQHPDLSEVIAVSENTFDFSKSSTVRMIILGDQVATFVNGQMAYTTRYPGLSTVYIYHGLYATNTIACEYDNFKLWDLSGVDFSAATTTTVPTSSFASILTSITDKAPNYEDDFSNLTSGWPTDRNSTGNEYGYQDGSYLISAKNICYSVDLPTYRVFSDFILEMDARFINLGEGTASIFFRNNDTAHYGANISPLGWVNFHKNVNGVHIPLLETEVPESSFQPWNTPNHLTLVARQNRMAIYINGELVIALADTSSSQGTLSFGVCDDNDDNPLQALIDNLKIWDITDLSP
jgi:tetratricopeptide (TPR) repeat protein